MRILIFHGYLLRGTGSNIYNASLVRALVRLGHEVPPLCPERHAGELGVVDAPAAWRLGFVDATAWGGGGSLEIAPLREPVRCTAYVPEIGGVLPVYVADRYEGFRAAPFAHLDDAAPGRAGGATAA